MKEKLNKWCDRYMMAVWIVLTMYATGVSVYSSIQTEKAIQISKESQRIAKACLRLAVKYKLESKAP